MKLLLFSRNPEKIMFLLCSGLLVLWCKITCSQFHLWKHFNAVTFAFSVLAISKVLKQTFALWCTFCSQEVLSTSWFCSSSLLFTYLFKVDIDREKEEYLDRGKSLVTNFGTITHRIFNHYSILTIYHYISTI